MADASVNKFETTVLPALQLAQDELISAGMESSQANEAFRELRMCLSSVSKKAFWKCSTKTQARALGSISHADKYFNKMV